MRHLKELAWSLLGGPAGVTLYTTDGGDAGAWRRGGWCCCPVPPAAHCCPCRYHRRRAGYMSHGALPGEVYASGDGDDLGVYAAEDQFNPAGWRAHISSEAYPGW